MTNIDTGSDGKKTYSGTDALLIYSPSRTVDVSWQFKSGTIPATLVSLSMSQPNPCNAVTQPENIMIVGTDEEIKAEATRLGFST